MLTALCILGGLLLLLNVPMFVLMVATAVIVIWAFKIAPLTLIATQMFGSIDKFALMATHSSFLAQASWAQED